MHEYVKIQVRSAGRLDARQWSPVCTQQPTESNVRLRAVRGGGFWKSS